MRVLDLEAVSGDVEIELGFGVGVGVGAEDGHRSR